MVILDLYMHIYQILKLYNTFILIVALILEKDIPTLTLISPSKHVY